ncbi:MAG: DUF4959 domain-containing protein, partial [Bacteroidota bacterium]
MKASRKLNLYLIIGTVLFFGCGEKYESGPLVADDTPPPPVTDVTIRNTPGGAIINYSIPDTEDLILVEASFVRNEEVVTTRSSIFNNELEIEGLISTEPQEVTLVAVDRSNNRSTPVTVNITPEQAPLINLFDSFSLESDFGGIRLNYDNGEAITTEMLLYTRDNSGNWTYDQSAFVINSESKKVTFRTFPPEAQEFYVIAIDRWNNVTPRLTATITPFEELRIDRLNFSPINLIG